MAAAQQHAQPFVKLTAQATGSGTPTGGDFTSFVMFDGLPRQLNIVSGGQWSSSLPYFFTSSVLCVNLEKSQEYADLT